MTTKIKVKKYRVERRRPGAEPSPAPADPPFPVAGESGDEFPQEAANPNPSPEAPDATPPAPGSAAEAIAAIGKEGLTTRQLRMARRLATKHGLEPSSDYDAVHKLRGRGIDPFARPNSLSRQSAGAAAPQPAPAAKAPTESAEPERVQLPQRRESDSLPDRPKRRSPLDQRMAEVARIQREIVRRRRRKLALLFARLSFFVLLPTLIAGIYYTRIATPMYATKSDFVIQTAETGSSGGFGAMLPMQLNTNRDSINVQSYLESRDAMLRLDEELQFKAHFQQPSIDPLQRLDADASNEDAYKVYSKRVKLGYDPTEGVIRMEVIAADPQTSQQISERLIAYAEERVDNLTIRKREDQLAEARRTLEKAVDDRRAAQEALVELQQTAALVDPEARISALRGQITQREIELQEKQLSLQALLDNLRPNQSRVDGVERDISRLEALLQDLRRQMNDANSGEDSLANVTTRIRLAQSDLEMQNLMLQSALQNMETSQIEVNRQTRYLSRSVDPVAPDEATYPRAFENTALAFLIFSGLYLVLSLTISVLREQVST
ncbi:hypothetical protein [Poseidonocella sedimentorum]|uniref:Capsular polysaccharide transport system permease protein n=1 Tax=Poseidonocella sedimentorum TaxID=871652 RepID=A0A1I6DSI0_9RHOB|nr:hypothetical protein [Poseidonocella sedimentorum]SFR08409.1 capsular polysaccharide transport system permease protein [Poseidonocella sedimentorum]